MVVGFLFRVHSNFFWIRNLAYLIDVKEDARERERRKKTHEGIVCGCVQRMYVREQRKKDIYTNCACVLSAEENTYTEWQDRIKDKSKRKKNQNQCEYIVERK